jgi:hypothetical protein
MAHGVGAVKEMYIGFFARRFAEAGMAAPLFDYRVFELAQLLNHLRVLGAFLVH